MTKKNRKVFACQDKLVPYRFHKGVYEAHYRREGLKIFVSAKEFEELKRRFSEKLSLALSQPKQTPIKIPSPPVISQQAQKTLDISPMFTQYIEQWLAIKKYTVKESTYKEYERICNYNLIPTFGNYTIEEMTNGKLSACPTTMSLLCNIDVLVDGRFVLEGTEVLK